MVESTLSTTGTHEADPSSQRKVLAQALANAGTSLGFLLGAGCGCSVLDATGAPLIPATPGLTKAVCDSLRASASGSQFKKLEVQYVVSGRVEIPNVELVLSRIRTLREVVGGGTVFDLSLSDLEALDEAICLSIEEIVQKDLPSGVSSHSMFARWIKEITRNRPIEVFTTNYDLLLEQALERERAPFFDGFVGSNEPFFDVSAMELDRLPERWTRVWKIHGSINWRLRDNSSIVRSRSQGTKPLIFPSHLKYAESRRLPYLAMRDRLRAFVKNRSVLITCGYSFSDEHLNEDLVFGLTSNAGSVCYGLLYGRLDQYGGAARVAQARPNLNLIAQDGGILRGKRVRWEGGNEQELGDFDGFGRFLTNEVMGEGDV